MSTIPRLAVSIGLLSASLLLGPLARGQVSGSISPHRWSTLRGLAQSADAILVGRATALAPGRVGGLVGGRMVETTDTTITVAVDQVVAGTPNVVNGSVQVLVTAADDPGLSPPTGPLLLFVSREGSQHRLCFAGDYGLYRMNGTRVEIWLEGTPPDERPELAALVPRLVGWQQERVRVDREATLSGSRLIVRYSLTNDGPRRVRVVPPSWVFDAIWVNQVRPGTNDRVGPDWAGIGHWGQLHEREPMRALAPGARTTFTYRIGLSRLQMAGPGEYMVGLRYEPHRTSTWAALREGAELPEDVFLGVPTERTVRVVVPTP